MQLIGILIALGIMLGTIPWAVEQADRQTTSSWARSTGNDLAEYAAGLRGFIANAQSNPAILPAAPVVGANWLKAPTCGGLAANPVDGYIPCHFGGIGGNDTVFDASYTTTFTRNAATNFIEARVTFIPQVNSNPATRGNVADAIVNAALDQNPVPANGMAVGFMSNVPTNANDLSARPGIIANPASPDFGRVLLIASNAPSNDLWLRTDGTNQMLATLNMGGNSIANARDIDAAGNVRIGGSAQVGNDLSVLNNTSIQGDLVVNGNISSDKNVNAGEDVIAQRDVKSGRDMVTGRDLLVTSGGNAFISNGVGGDAAGVLFTDDVSITDATLSNGTSPRASQAVYEQYVTDGITTAIPKPTCANNGTPRIYASFQAVASPDGFPIANSKVQVDDLGANWNVSALVETSGSGGMVASPNSLIVVSTKCN